MATKVTIQDIANELQLSRNTVSKAINNTGVLADATREKIGFAQDLFPCGICQHTGVVDGL